MRWENIDTSMCYVVNLMDVVEDRKTINELQVSHARLVSKRIGMK